MLEIKINPNPKKILRIFSLLTAAISLSSFIQKLFTVGLKPLFFDFISYYRKIAHLFFIAPEYILNIHVPQKLADFWVLSFICAGAYVRSANVEYARAFQTYNFKRPSYKLRSVIFVVFGITGLSLFIPLSLFSIYTYERDDITREALKNIAFVIMAACLFFILNAFAPSA